MLCVCEMMVCVMMGMMMWRGVFVCEMIDGVMWEMKNLIVVLCDVMIVCDV